MKLTLLERYDKPTPRYTSYPTVPYWEGMPSEQLWLTQVGETVSRNREISLYIHMPFCEKLCTYCGCNKRITKNHAVERPYIDSLLSEWLQYLEVLPEKVQLKELHLGGGTPTFFSPQSIAYLMENLTATVHIPEDHAFGFEAHPNNATYEHLKIFRQFGFNRLSVGVQDFSPVIMRAINRKQNESDIYKITEDARSLGYTSINYDFVYGLPFQRLQHIHYNIDKLAELMPDRIAYYSYAHVPWKQANQRKFTLSDVPQGVDKRLLQETAEIGLEKLGYRTIGMDHYALPEDQLYSFYKAGTLHRNFMGYTPYTTNLLIGLGASAISESPQSFVQNAPVVEDYQSAIREGGLAIYRGHHLNEEDQQMRVHIKNIMCHLYTEWERSEWEHLTEVRKAYDRLKPMARDHLVELTPRSVTVTSTGLPFVRNIAQCFDARFWRRQPSSPVFSKSL